MANRRGRTQAQLEADKGVEVQIISGKYQDHPFQIWKDNFNGPVSATRAHIIVQERNQSGVLQLRATYCKKEYCTDLPPPPTSRAEAVLCDVPEVNRLMWALARQLAACNLSDDDVLGIEELFSTRIEEAQRDFGTQRRRMVHLIEFNADEIKMNDTNGNGNNNNE